MSWGVVTQDADKEALLEHLIDEMQIPDYITVARAEAEQQLEAGKAAAKALLASATLGVPGSIFRVGINGHSNDLHVKSPGWAHEMLNVVVYELAQPEIPSEPTSGPAEPVASEATSAPSDMSASVSTPDSSPATPEPDSASSQSEVTSEN